MHLIAKAIRISHAKLSCNKLATVQDIQDYVNLIFCAHCTYIMSHKKRATQYSFTTLTNGDRFFDFFHCLTQQ